MVVGMPEYDCCEHCTEHVAGPAKSHHTPCPQCVRAAALAHLRDELGGMGVV